MTVLARLAKSRGAVERPRILVASVNALTQRAPPLAYLKSAAFSAAPGNSVRMEDLAHWLESNGYARASTVRDVGDYASRGGILDLYPPGAAAPIRLDFFGDTLESIRAFDPETQRSTTQLRSLDLVPMSEARLTTDSIKRFRQGYAAEFGAPAPNDDLYAAISEGRRAIGVEHWLPLLYDKLDTIFDYVGDAPFVLDGRADDAAHERIALITDNYAARRAAYAEDPARRTISRCRRRGFISAKASGRSGWPASRWRGSRHSKRSRAQATSSIAAGGRGAISLPSGRTRAPMCSTPRSRMCGRCASGA